MKEGRVALVTGASRGVGEAVARAFRAATVASAKSSIGGPWDSLRREPASWLLRLAQRAGETGREYERTPARGACRLTSENANPVDRYGAVEMVAEKESTIPELR